MHTGIRSIVTGTYVAEQRDKAVYDLISPTSNPGGACPREAAPRKRKVIRRPEPTKCAELPALASIEPLLGEKAWRPGTVFSSLPSIPVNTDSARSCTSSFGLIVPPDHVFNQWLEPPSTSRRGMTSRQTNSVSPPCFDDEDLPPVPDYVWHILLLDKTFSVKANTIHHVASCLCVELGIDRSAALEKVEMAAQANASKLMGFRSHKDAYNKMEKLLDCGLAVRMSKGLASLEDHPPVLLKRKYTDMFNRQKLLGRKNKAPPKLPPMSMASTSGCGWRKKRESIAVISEDPVGDLLRLEQQTIDQAHDEQASTETGHDEQPTISPLAVRKIAAFKMAISRHRKTLNIKEKELPKVKTVNDVLQALKAGGGGEHKKTLAEVMQPPASSTREHIVLDAERKEACKMLRIFAFGMVGNESAATDKDKNSVFYEPVGSKQEVLTLYSLWKKLDDDNSGRVDIQEFRVFADHHMKDHVMENQSSEDDTQKFISKLCDKLVTLLLGKKSSFVIDDMMKVMWPCADPTHIKTMKTWCKEFAAQATKTRVATPPVLPEDDFEGLTSVFSHFDEDNSGTVSLDELIAKGLIYEDQVAEYLADWGKAQSDGLDLLEFCEMMCPAGYRAHEKAKTASLPNGSRVYLDTRLNVWREEGSDEPEPLLSW